MRSEDFPDPTRRVVLEFSYNRSEFVRAVRWLWLRRSDTPVMAAIGLTCLVLGAVLVSKFAVGASFLLLVGALCVIIDITAIMILPGSRWRTRPDLRASRYYAFADSGVEVRTETLDVKIAWSQFASTRESSRCYLLQVGNSRSYLYLPKRTFESQSDELAFRKMAERNTQAHLRPQGQRQPARQLLTRRVRTVALSWHPRSWKASGRHLGQRQDAP